MIIGAVLFLFMRTLGELLLSDRKYATFADIARDLIGPWAGFVTGWTYWACWVVTGVADMIAITGYTHFWWPDLAPVDSHHRHDAVAVRPQRDDGQGFR